MTPRCGGFSAQGPKLVVIVGRGSPDQGATQIAAKVTANQPTRTGRRDPRSDGPAVRGRRRAGWPAGVGGMSGVGDGQSGADGRPAREPVGEDGPLAVAGRPWLDRVRGP